MLSVEKKLIDFLSDDKQRREYKIKERERIIIYLIFFRIQSYRFDAMNPYHRMLVHRIGAFFCLRHNVDQTKQCVIVSKLEKSRV